MPQTKLQNFIFTLMMVIVMVYGMVCYNVALATGGMRNEVFLIALGELPIMGVIAFLLEFFIVEKIAHKLTFRLLNPKEVPAIFITLMLSAFIIMFMCPFMSFFATVLFNNHGLSSLFPTWLEAIVKNFPMAFFYQMCYAGPFVRFLFRLIFQRQQKNL